jgi:acyl-CoA thioester hydrolase/thioesterase-3
MNSIFETEIRVRPDDIDMNNHVHYSKYLDYLLTARYDQMKKDYQMPMEEFLDMGYTWVASTMHIDYKRAIQLKDTVVVKTQVDSYKGAQVTVNFWMYIKEKNKLASEGYVVYTLISTRSGRPVRIPEDVVSKYTI